MNIIHSERLLIEKREMYLTKTGKIEDGCNCPCSYTQLEMPVMKYVDLYYQDTDSLYNNLSGKYTRFLREFSLIPLEKYLYDNFFDHNKLNIKHWNVIRFFAFLNPESDESKQYFLKEYDETYEELYRKTHDENELQKLRELAVQQEQERTQRELARQEALHPTPKCPICGSTKLTKISTITKAAKISAFGIYGAGDIGKTYKCNNCGGKF